MPDPVPDVCPHCGQSPALYETGTNNFGRATYAVICPCGCNTNDCTTKQAAATIWDARPSDSYLIRDWDPEVTTYSGAPASLVAHSDQLWAGLKPETGSAPGTKDGEWILLAN